MSYSQETSRPWALDGRELVDAKGRRLAADVCSDEVGYLLAAAPDLLALAKQYASSCINCAGHGFTYVAGEPFTQEETARERIDCEECAHIREGISRAEGRS